MVLMRHAVAATTEDAVISVVCYCEEPCWQAHIAIGAQTYLKGGETAGVARMTAMLKAGLRFTLGSWCMSLSGQKTKFIRTFRKPQTRSTAFERT